MPGLCDDDLGEAAEQPIAFERLVHHMFLETPVRSGRDA